MSPLPVALIGAGCSGFTTAKRLRDEGVVFDWFEASDRIGGNWAYNNPNGMSSAYQSLHIDTSKWRLQFAEYPVPADWPEQKVQIVQEDVSPDVRGLRYRTLPGGVKQMIVEILALVDPAVEKHPVGGGWQAHHRLKRPEIPLRVDRQMAPRVEGV